jgi:hypothetical protein
MRTNVREKKFGCTVAREDEPVFTVLVQRQWESRSATPLAQID